MKSFLFSLKTTILSFFFLLSAVFGFGQTTIVNYDFNIGNSYATLIPILASNITSTPTGTELFTTLTGTASGAAAFTSNATAVNALSMADSSGNNSKYFQFKLGGSALSTYTSYKIYMQGQRSGSGAQTLTIAYSTNGTSYTNFATTRSTGNSMFSEATFDLSSITALNSQSAVYFRVLVSGGTPGGTLRIDNFQIQATAGSSVISTTGTLSAVNTTYGSASASPSTFSVSGAGMTAGILVTPPSTNFEVSLSSGSGYANTITVGAAGTIASTPVYVRLKATATVVGSPYSGNIILSSAGATSVNVATASSTVAPYPITVSGALASNKIYNGTTGATVSGGTLIGVFPADVGNVSISTTGTFASANVGTGIAVTVALTGSAASNYSLTQPGLMADITKANQTITFNALPALNQNSTPVNLNTYASASSGLALTYASSNPPVVSVSGNTLTVVGLGTSTITASQAGNGNYNAAPNATQSVIVSKVPAVIAQFDFTTGSMPTASVVTTKNTNVSVTNFALSSDLFSTQVTSGNQFPNEPFAAGVAGWTSTTQAGAKNFNFNVTANPGYEIEVTGFKFNALATAAGPSAFSFDIATGSASYTTNAPITALVAVDEALAGLMNLTSVPVLIQGWLNGSRSSTGGGIFRIDDVILKGYVTCIKPAAYNVTGGGSYCIGGATVPVGLSNSQLGMSYQLQLDGVNFGSAIAGTGSAISFGNQSTAGTYTVVATNVNCAASAVMTGNAVIVVNPILNASVTIAASPSGPICAGTSVTFTATPTNGGTTPTYQWKKNGTDIPGQTASTFASTTLANSDVVTVVMTSSATPCLTGSPVTSTGITMNVSPKIDFANLQFPGSSTICQSQTLTAYGQVYQAGITNLGGQAAGITVQFGYNSTNVDPSTWAAGNWTNASYESDQGNNDQYSYTFSPPSSGTFYYTFRYKSGSCDWKYGGFNGGFWDSVGNINGSLVVNATSVAGTVSANQAICSGNTPNNIFLTGYNGTIQWQSSTISDSSGFNNIGGATNSTLTLGAVNTTTYYRAIVTSGVCSTATSAVVTIEVTQPITYANLQYPGTENICQGGSLTAYGQVYKAGVTPGAGIQGVGIIAEFGYNSSNTNPATWTNWSAATFNPGGGGTNNDEYQYVFTPATSGALYYTFRYKTGDCDWVYGGYKLNSGGFWDGNDFINGVLNINPTAVAGTAAANQSIAYGTTPADLSLTGSVGTVQWQSSLNNSTFTNIPGANSTILLGSTIGNLTATTYYKAIISTVCGSPKESNVITIAVSDITTWNGSIANNWDYGIPNINLNAVINGDYSTSTNLVSKTLTVNGSKTLTIPANTSFTTGNFTNNGNVLVESDGNFVQTVGAVNSGTGTFTVNRTANMKRLDYTYWGSPVSGQMLKAFSPGTLNTRFLTYNELDDTFSAVATPSSTPFAGAKGYAIRADNNYPAWTFPAPIAVYRDFVGIFSGTPNNGNVSYSLAKSGAGYNLVGNPYASNIDFNTLFASGAIDGTAYFWTNVNINPPAAGLLYDGANYATLTTTGAAPSTNGAVADTPTRYIKVGQGFIVKATSATNLIFTNAMRDDGTGTSRFINKGGVGVNDPIDRFWLKLITPAQNFNTILIGYLEGATNSFESFADAEQFGESSDSFYSVLNNYKLNIQGRQFPLIKSDIIPLGLKAFESGTYKIAMVEKEGIFANGQNIYLKDNQTGTTVNLSENDYTFTANAGVTDGRFEIVYKNDIVLAAGNVAKDQIMVYRDGNDFVIKSDTKNISELEMYDTGGRLLLKLKPNKTETRIDASTMVNGVYVLKMSRNGEISTKKISK